MNAIPELLKPNSASHCPGGAPSRVSKLSKTGKKLMPLPECLRASTFGFLISDLLSLLLTLTVCACLTGCSFLKPAKPTARYFVLTPLPATGPGLAAPNTLAVGLGQVKLPAYLFETSLAVRKGTNEIEYLPSSLWAERLDTGFQRVLAANLAIVLPTDRRSACPPGRRMPSPRNSLSASSSSTWTPAAVECSSRIGASSRREERRPSRPAGAGLRAGPAAGRRRIRRRQPP